MNFRDRAFELFDNPMEFFDQRIRIIQNRWIINLCCY